MLRNEVDAGMRVLRDVATTLSAARRQLDAERTAFEQQRADAEKFAEEPALPPGEERERDDNASAGPSPSGDLHVVAAKEDPEHTTDAGAHCVSRGAAAIVDASFSQRQPDVS
jgi:hypothetical protein